jgi:gamma-D-glutamyl-L-lysine dipeptidyl-peptidase
METGIIDLSLVAVRRQPDDKSEMINQLLFGELIYVLEQQEKWTRIKSEWDDYEGWIDSKQWMRLDKNEFENLKEIAPVLCENLTERIHAETEDKLIVFGSVLPNFNDYNIGFDKKTYTIINQINMKITRTDLDSIINKYLNVPYLWGGRSIFGIDCSGFTQMVFKFIGVRLKRDAWQQAEQGTLISSLSKAKKNDLIFFKNNDGKIVHEGIYLGENKIVHASGKVRIDKVDESGIYIENEKRYSHAFNSIRRIEHTGL